MEISTIALDVAAVVIVLWCACAAAKKGFLCTVIQMIAYVAILMAASFFSKAAAPVIYDRVVEPMLLNRIQQESEAPRPRQNAALISAVPQELLTALEDLLDDAKDTAEGLLPEALELDPAGLAEDLADAMLRPLMINGIAMVAFVLLFATLSLLANILLSTLGLLNYLPVVGTFNALLGAAVGILQGMLLVWLLAVFLQGLLHLYPQGVWIFDPGVIERTWIFKYFADPALLKTLAF